MGVLFGMPESVVIRDAESLGPGVSSCLCLPLRVSNTSGIRFGRPRPLFSGVLHSIGLGGSGVWLSSDINIFALLRRAVGIGETIASESSVGAGLSKRLVGSGTVGLGIMRSSVDLAPGLFIGDHATCGS